MCFIYIYRKKIFDLHIYIYTIITNSIAILIIIKVYKFLIHNLYKNLQKELNISC